MTNIFFFFCIILKDKAFYKVWVYTSKQISRKDEKSKNLHPPYPFFLYIPTLYIDKGEYKLLCELKFNFLLSVCKVPSHHHHRHHHRHILRRCRRCRCRRLFSFLSLTAHTHTHTFDKFYICTHTNIVNVDGRKKG